VIKAVDKAKPSMEYEFDLDHDPKRYLTLKTKRKKEILKKDKTNLHFHQIVRAQEVLDKAVLDARYTLH
jgi:hypothetical protein